MLRAMRVEGGKDMQRALRVEGGKDLRRALRVEGGKGMQRALRVEGGKENRALWYPKHKKNIFGPSHNFLTPPYRVEVRFWVQQSPIGLICSEIRAICCIPGHAKTYPYQERLCIFEQM